MQIHLQNVFVDMLGTLGGLERCNYIFQDAFVDLFCVLGRIDRCKFIFHDVLVDMSGAPLGALGSLER